MLMPKRVKRRKQFRGSMRGKALRGNKITNGDYGIVAMEPRNCLRRFTLFGINIIYRSLPCVLLSEEPRLCRSKL